MALTLSQQPSSIYVGATSTIYVTGVDSFSVSLSESIYVTYKLLDNGYSGFTLTGIAAGYTTIEVSAEVNGEKESIKWILQSSVEETYLEVTNYSTTMYVGETNTLNISTNGDYTITSSNENVARLKSYTASTIEAIGIGDTTISVSSTLSGGDTETFEYTIQVSYQQAVNDSDDSSDGVALKLKNLTTSRTVSLATSNNSSITDITIKLPSSSGTLLREEDMANDSMNVIQTPTIITPADGTMYWSGTFYGSDYITNYGFTEELESSIWEVASDTSFSTIITTKTVDKSVSTTLNEVGSGLYYVRVKYKAGDYESSYSDYITVGFGDYNTETSNALSTLSALTSYSVTTQTTNTLLSTSTYTNGYFGVIKNSQLVSNYNHRGNWDSIVAAFSTDNYYTTTDSETTTLDTLKFEPGDTVLKDDVLYYSIKTNTMTSVDDAIVPGTDTKYWKEDTRTGLAKPKWVINKLGIPVGKIDTFLGQSNSDTVGELSGSSSDYIKYLYRGKVCYITQKPVITNISYIDLALREIVSGNRTLRMGGKLYRIRLPYEDEYAEIMIRLMDGTYSTQTSDTLEAEVKCFLHATYDDGSYSVNVGHISDNELKVTVADIRDRSFGFRYVIEYIPEDIAPYCNLEQYYGSNIWSSENETLIYDKYTDTGYFGVISADDSVTGDKLAITLEYLDGADQNSSAGWLKFYWHGLILYVAKKTLKSGISYQTLLDNNLVFGNTIYTDNDVNYRVSLLTGTSHTPYDSYEMDTSTTNKLNVSNVISNITYNSQVSDLLWRVTEGYAGYTITGSNDTYVMGMQSGDNWASMSATELHLTNSTGNGTASLTRDYEVGNTNNVFYAGYNNNYATGSITCDSKTSMNGWRPVLIVDPKWFMV